MASLRQKLNVLMVNYEFPPIGGGGGTTTRFLAKFLIKLGLNVTIVTSRSQDDNIYHHPEGFSIHYIGSKKSKISTTHIPELIRFGLLLIYHSKKLINIIKPDLLHCFFTLPSGSFGLFCKKRYNIPYITSVLGADVPGFNIGDWRLNTYHALTSVLSKAIWDNSSFIAANSQSLKDTCIKFSTKQDVKVISNGVDSDVFFPNKEKKEDKSNEVELLFISRLMYQKGIDTLIKACGILKEKNITNFRLNIVGDGHLNHEIRKDSRFYSLTISCNFTEDMNYFSNNINPLFKKLFNTNLSVIKSKNFNYFNAVKCSKSIVNFLSLNFSIPIGNKTADISIPTIIANSGNSIKNVFIRGLADTDFSLSFKKRKQFHSSVVRTEI